MAVDSGGTSPTDDASSDAAIPVADATTPPAPPGPPPKDAGHDAAPIDSGHPMPPADAGATCLSLKGTCEPDAPGACLGGSVVNGSCNASGDICCVINVSPGLDAGGTPCAEAGGKCEPVTLSGCLIGGPVNISCGGGIGMQCCMPPDAG